MPENRKLPESRKLQERLDQRSPFVYDTREVGRRPGSMKRLQRPVPGPGDLGLELVKVPLGADIELDLRVESVVEGVLVSGAAAAPIVGECGRCLGPIERTVEVDVQELFAYPDSETDATADEDEVSRVQGDLIDLEPMLRDAIVLALPTNPLCRDDCAGLCADCGQRLDDLPPGHSHEQADPRWAALDGVFSPDGGPSPN
jgi:uncharacterized protein